MIFSFSLPQLVFLIEVIAGAHFFDDSQQFVVFNRKYFDFSLILFELIAVLRMLTSCSALVEYFNGIFELCYYLVLDLQLLLQTKN
jgi:hypothetical protein